MPFLKTVIDAYKTSLRKCLGKADFQKWDGLSNLSPKWDSRTRYIASLIPHGKSVLEFGAGRMVLKDCLGEGCTYTPSDLIDRGNGTIVCNLNQRNLPDFPKHDVAVLIGVLEYINDVPRLVLHLAKYVNAIVVSYAVTDHRPKKMNRRANGWVNDYSSAELEKIFETNGFRIDHTDEWNSHNIYRFVKD